MDLSDVPVNSDPYLALKYRLIVQSRRRCYLRRCQTRLEDDLDPVLPTPLRLRFNLGLLARLCKVQSEDPTPRKVVLPSASRHMLPHLPRRVRRIDQAGPRRRTAAMPIQDHSRVSETSSWWLTPSPRKALSTTHRRRRMFPALKQTQPRLRLPYRRSARRLAIPSDPVFHQRTLFASKDHLVLASTILLRWQATRQRRLTQAACFLDQPWSNLMNGS